MRSGSCIDLLPLPFEHLLLRDRERGARRRRELVQVDAEEVLRAGSPRLVRRLAVAAVAGVDAAVPRLR